MSKREELKCPRCGYDAYVGTTNFGGSSWVCCDNLDDCWLSGPICKTREEAIKEWNRLRYEKEEE